MKSSFTKGNKLNSTFVYFVEDTETSFVINDIKEIASVYEEVILMSAESIDNKSDLPQNVKAFESFINWKNLDLKKILVQNFFGILSRYISECLATRKFLSPRQSLAVIGSNYYKANEVMRVLKAYKNIDYGKVPFYAFWFYDCIYLARLKEIGFAKKIFSRAHGGDVFEERSSLSGKVLFRHYQLKLLNGVFSVSNAGTEYLKQKYKQHASKIQTIYLGSFHHEKMNPFVKNELVIVSCAKIRDVKRIHLIAEALKHIEIPCKWFHLGDENLDAENDETIPKYIKAKEELIQSKHIQHTAMGAMDNDDIYKFYELTPITAFISVSESEGIPVSMMEAISFGIPVISTDVGGCKEIVTPNSGILIPKNSSPEQIATSILDFYSSNKNSNEFRQKVREYWLKTFDMKSNYKQLFETLQKDV